MDRNPNSIRRCLMSAVSLSARRAWIEIVITAMTSQISVWSLSARRAWIEITVVGVLATLVTGRSPQGERG